MKKSEMLNLKEGQVIMDIRTNANHSISEVTENNIVIDGSKKVAMSTLKRYYKLVEQEIVEEPVVEETVVEVEQTEEPQIVEETIEEEVVEPEIVEEVVQVEEIIKPEIQEAVKEEKQEELIEVDCVPVASNEVTLTNLIAICEGHNCQIKKNSNHYAIRYGKKNVIEIYPTKTKGMSIAVRNTLFTDDEIMNLNDARLVGNGTYVLDLKFRIDSLQQFSSILGLAIFNK